MIKGHSLVNTTTTARSTPLSNKEKLGYGFGDAGFNLYWTTIASFIAAFYTDVFGISAAAAGTMLLVTKIFDAFTDPVMGAVADRTRTRWGKFRPFLIWGGAPLALAAFMTFTTPELSEIGRLVWAYVTYSVMMICYTIVSTPYSALSGVMTSRSQDRTALISIRFIFAFGCGALVNRYTLPLVEQFGQGDPARGWQLTIGLYGALATLIFLLTFLSTKERIAPPPAQQTHAVDDIKDLLGNKPWLILFALALIIMLTITMRAGSAYYYFNYYLVRPDLLPSYLFWQMIFYAVGAACTPLLTRFIDKARLLMLLMALTATFSICMYFVPKDGITLIFILNCLISLCLGPKSPLTWSMYADTADYTEWQTGRRATAMTFAAATFSQKLGGAFGSAIMLWLLALLGYEANKAQDGSSLFGINLLQTAIPGAFALMAALLVTRYALTGARLRKIQQDLEDR